MIRIGICDDDSIMVGNIEKRTRKFFEERGDEIILKTYTDAGKFQSACESMDYHLILLDVDMPEVTGFELAEKIKKKSRDTVIIFISGRDTLVYESIKYQPFRFIRKSVYEVELQEALHSFLQSRTVTSKKEELECESGMQMIIITDVMYIESKGHILEMTVSDGSNLRTKRHAITMKELEGRWREYGFIRIERGYLVNFRFIKCIRDKEVEMKDGAILSIGRGRVEDVKKRFRELIRREDR